MGQGLRGVICYERLNSLVFTEEDMISELKTLVRGAYLFSQFQQLNSSSLVLVAHLLQDVLGIRR